MRIGILTNEYPPNVYGGAGVHVEYLTRELPRSRRAATSCACSRSAIRPTARQRSWSTACSRRCKIAAQDPRHGKLFDTLQQNLVMGGMATDLDIVHCHTWYSHFAGCLVKHLQDVPLVLTTHSLEPHRPWKVEQLGTAYNASSWIERTAYQNADGVVAVSAAMKHDVQSLYGVAPDKVRIIHNGIDLQQYRPRPDPSVLGAIRHPRRRAVRAVRRTHHPAEGHHPSRQRDPAHPPGRPDRAVRRRAGHPGDRQRDDRRRRTRARAEVRTTSSGSRRCCPRIR